MQVSFVVPIYNSIQVLPRCLQCLHNQTFTNWEAVLVDDGSSDGSSQICDDAANMDKRIRVIHQSNSGVSTARNRGIEAAQGEWIAFVDCDDEIASDYLANLLAQVPADHYIGNHVLIIGGEERNIGCKAIQHYSLPNEAKKILDFDATHHVDKHVFLYCWGRLFKRSIIERYNIRFDTSLKFAEDTIFGIDYLSHCSQCVQIPDANYRYYFSSTNLFERYTMPFDVFRQHIERWERCIDDYKKEMRCYGSLLVEKNCANAIYECFKYYCLHAPSKEEYNSNVCTFLDWKENPVFKLWPERRSYWIWLARKVNIKYYIAYIISRVKSL